MGLDWKPMNKPHNGFEDEYERIFKILTGEVKQNISLINKLKGKRELSQEELLERFLSISTTAYETLNAPQVGLNEAATKWAEDKFESQEDKSLTLEEFMNQMNGYYVLDLVPECDGLPMYITMHDEAHVFRAEFLNDCQEIIGKELHDEAYESKLAHETKNYANRLMEVAKKYANDNNCPELINIRKPPQSDEDSPESKAHILFSAGKWLKYWSEKGHGMEADF
tara:strand:- start:580 stop:1254 length:675 start_codon:yes stop_codon:yes gene_type:complete